MIQFEDLNAVLALLKCTCVQEIADLGDEAKEQCDSIIQLAGFLEKESGVTPTVVDEINKAIEICLKVGYSFNNPTQYQIGMLMDCIMMMSADVNELNYAEFINATRVMIETIQLWNPTYMIPDEEYSNINHSAIFQLSNKTSSKYKSVDNNMINMCYEQGKFIYENQFEPEYQRIKKCAEMVSEETGMNKSTAIISITFAKSLLNGDYYARRISANMLDVFLNRINSEYDENQLMIALEMVEKHIVGLKKADLNVNKLILVYDKYKNLISEDETIGITM